MIGDDWIEEIARKLCREEGVDPDAEVEASATGVLTSLEQIRMARNSRSGDSARMTVPAWRTYRAAAARLYFGSLPSASLAAGRSAEAA